MIIEYLSGGILMKNKKNIVEQMGDLIFYVYILTGVSVIPIWVFLNWINNTKFIYWALATVTLFWIFIYILKFEHFPKLAFGKKYYSAPLSLKVMISLQWLLTITSIMVFIDLLIVFKPLTVETFITLFGILLAVLGIIYSIYNNNLANLKVYEKDYINISKEKMKFVLGQQYSRERVNMRRLENRRYIRRGRHKNYRKYKNS